MEIAYTHNTVNCQKWDNNKLGYSSASPVLHFISSSAPQPAITPMAGRPSRARRVCPARTCRGTSSRFLWGFVDGRMGVVEFPTRQRTESGSGRISDRRAGRRRKAAIPRTHRPSRSAGVHDTELAKKTTGVCTGLSLGHSTSSRTRRQLELGYMVKRDPFRQAVKPNIRRPVALLQGHEPPKTQLPRAEPPQSPVRG